MRAKFIVRQPGQVEMTLTSDTATPVAHRTYSVPTNGGYIRDQHGRQVCHHLNYRGETLTATPATLLAVVRREWAARRNASRQWP